MGAIDMDRTLSDDSVIEPLRTLGNYKKTGKFHTEKTKRIGLASWWSMQALLLPGQDIFFN